MITATTQLIGFFADPAFHSKSPAMHNSAFRELGLDYCYMAFNIPDGEIGSAIAAMKTLNMRGANISMPHKAAVMAYLDEIDSGAELCGAVNTVVNQGDVLKGYNTDMIGAVKALKEMGNIVRDERIVMLGLGGAGKAVLAGLAMEGPTEISVFARLVGADADPGKVGDKENYISNIVRKTGANVNLMDLSNEDLLGEKLGSSTILINCTSVGMGASAGKSLIPDESYLNEDLSVMDIIYEPAETELLKQAASAGVKKYKNGLDMLLYQGTEAFRIFTGLDAPAEIMKSVL